MARSKHGSPTLVLKITDEQIDTAIQSNSGGCLIADAIRNQYPHYTGVVVDMATVRLTDRKAGVRYTYLTPPPAQHCLLSFDQGWPNPVPEVTLRRAVKITKVIHSPKQVADNKAARAVRIATLEAKAESGEPLTTVERRSLSASRRYAAAERPMRPSARGRSDVKVTDGGENHGAVVAGGLPLPQGPAHPNLLRGRDRHFGAKLADPGQAFREAVAKGVAEELAAIAD